MLNCLLSRQQDHAKTTNACNKSIESVKGNKIHYFFSEEEEYVFTGDRTKIPIKNERKRKFPK